ncbi:MAG: hypothetical protein SPF70_08255 [Lachnospiraceae bacterium]|nr:hypothetical protein [Lachnospiraceae bacterium]
MKKEVRGLNEILVTLANNIAYKSNCLTLWGEEKLQECFRKKKI